MKRLTYKLVTQPAKILKQKAKKVEVFDAEVIVLADAMLKIIKDNNGVGLAANQANSRASMIVLVKSSARIYIMVNPEIVKHSKSTKPGVEGCLSSPGFTRQIDRWSRVTVAWQTIDGDDRRQTFQGWLARQIQHEVDHLNGISINDKGAGV